MALSFAKLESFLKAKGYSLSNIFTQDNECFLLEVVSKSAAGSFMVYIPSKYTIPCQSMTAQNVYELTAVGDEGGGNDEERDESKDDGEEVMDELYDKFEDDDDPESTIDNAYKKPIGGVGVLNQAAVKKKNIHLISTQLKRLRKCVESSKFKLAVAAHSIIGVIRRDESVDIFEASGLQRDDIGFRLFVVVDLDMLYETRNSERFNSEIAKIHAAVYGVMDRSRQALMTYFGKILKSVASAVSKVDLVFDRKAKYDVYTTYFDAALLQLATVEQRNLEQLEEIRQNTKSDSSMRAIQADMATAHRKKQLEDERNMILTTKRSILDLSSSIHSEMDNFVLAIDNYFFETVKLLSTVSKNLEQIQKL